MKKYKIFIIEDNKTEAMIMRLAFSGLKNLDPHYFDSGNKIINSLEENPDIVICDLNLPDIYGLEIIEKVKAYNPEIEVVVISAQDDVEVISQAQDMGVFNYVVKSESCLVYIKKVIENLILVLEARQKA
jgi:two-component system, chemotaxis family, chemotaxis protein CheY